MKRGQVERGPNPEPIEKLIEEFARLPGIGRRSAERMAFHVLKSSGDEVRRLSQAIEAVKRDIAGRPWILDEYLVDVVDMASGTAGAEGETVPLSDMIRKVGRELVVERVAWWYEASPAEIQMIKAHVEDMAVAAEAMRGEREERSAEDVSSLIHSRSVPVLVLAGTDVAGAPTPTPAPISGDGGGPSSVRTRSGAA